MWSHDVPLPGLFLFIFRMGRLFLVFVHHPRRCAIANAHDAHSGIFSILEIPFDSSTLCASRCNVTRGVHCSQWHQYKASLSLSLTVLSILPDQICSSSCDVKQWVIICVSTSLAVRGMTTGSGSMWSRSLFVTIWRLSHLVGVFFSVITLFWYWIYQLRRRLLFSIDRTFNSRLFNEDIWWGWRGYCCRLLVYSNFLINCLIVFFFFVFVIDKSFIVGR